MDGMLSPLAVKVKLKDTEVMVSSNHNAVEYRSYSLKFSRAKISRISRILTSLENFNLFLQRCLLKLITVSSLSLWYCFLKRTLRICDLQNRKNFNTKITF